MQRKESEKTPKTIGEMDVYELKPILTKKLGQDIDIASLITMSDEEFANSWEKLLLAFLVAVNTKKISNDEAETLKGRFLDHLNDYRLLNSDIIKKNNEEEERLRIQVVQPIQSDNNSNVNSSQAQMDQSTTDLKVDSSQAQIAQSTNNSNDFDAIEETNNDENKETDDIEKDFQEISSGSPDLNNNNNNNNNNNFTQRPTNLLDGTLTKTKETFNNIGTNIGKRASIIGNKASQFFSLTGSVSASRQSGNAKSKLPISTLSPEELQNRSEEGRYKLYSLLRDYVAKKEKANTNVFSKHKPLVSQTIGIVEFSREDRVAAAEKMMAYLNYLDDKKPDKVKIDAQKFFTPKQVAILYSESSDLSTYMKTYESCLDQADLKIFQAKLQQWKKSTAANDMLTNIFGKK